MPLGFAEYSYLYAEEYFGTLHLGGKISLMLYALWRALKLGNLIIKICSGSAVVLWKMETKVDRSNCKRVSVLTVPTDCAYCCTY